MRLRDKFRLFAIGLLLALTAALAVAAPATPSAGAAALSQAVFESELGEAAAPGHAPACLEQHDPCKPGSVATALPASATPHAVPSRAFVKAPAFLPAPLPDVAPHAAASLFILFRNLRE